MNILELKRKLLPMSGPQGGGSGSGGDSSQTVTRDLPDWAKGYAKNTLERAAAATDQPYQPYGGERLAGFSPLQVQSQDAAAAMTTPSTAGDVASRALGTNYATGQFTGGQFGGAEAQQYMNPYMQNVVDIQQREAQRQADIAGTQRNAQAVGAGAFGGSRQAIMDAEAARNLATQKGDIQAQGSNLAFQQAQQQFNADQARRMQAQQLGEQSRQYGAGLGMQGLSTALAASGQGFQQGMDINRLQNAYGGQQQALRQQGLTQGYEDFLRQQQDPFTKLGFMSNMINGLPVGGTTQTVGSQGSPSAIQTLGALGAGAYGLSKFMAAGGSVDSQENIEEIVSKLSDKQLEQAQQAAKARGDGEQLQIIALEQASRASMKRGLGAVPVNAEKMMPTQESMARGGIVAFARGGVGTIDDDYDEGYNPNASPSSYTGLNAKLEDVEDVERPGNQSVYDASVRGMLQAIEDTRKAQYAPFTETDRLAAMKKARAELVEGMGVSPYEEQRKEIAQSKADMAKNLEQGKGLAALRAAGAMLQGGNAIRGLAAGAGEFGNAYSEVVRADQAGKRALQNMQINLADAERKEKMGLNKEAIEAANRAQRAHHDLQTFNIDKAKALGAMYRGAAAATKPGSKAAAEPKVAEATLKGLVDTRMDKEKPKAGETLEQMRSRITAEEGPKLLAIMRSSSSVTNIGGDKAILAAAGEERAKQIAANAQVDRWFDR